MKLKFTKMEEVHLEQVLQIEENAFSSPWNKEAFLSEIKANDFAHYIVGIYEDEHETVVVGYAGMWIILDELHITTIAVREDCRGQKIGQLLLQHLFALGKIKSAEKATLEVRPSNEVAQRLYENMGFKAYGIRKNYYQDDGEDAIIMWKDI